jgi:hypothetical protein
LRVATDNVWAEELEELEKELGPLPPDPVVKPATGPAAEKPAELDPPASTPAPPPAT